MLTRRARTTKEIAAAKSSGIFNGLKIVVDVPDFFFASSKTEWSICKSDCERILESAGAEVLRERDYVVLDSYFGENETDSPVPDSEDDEQDEQNIKQQQQQRSKGEWKFKRRRAPRSTSFCSTATRNLNYNASKSETDVSERKSRRLAMVCRLFSERVHVRNGGYVRNASRRALPSTKFSIVNKRVSLARARDQRTRRLGNDVVAARVKCIIIVFLF